MKKETGGSAFPVLELRNANGDVIIYPEAGMTLRDWFAGQSIGAIISSTLKVKDVSTQEMVDAAYEIADAMLKVRNGEE